MIVQNIKTRIHMGYIVRYENFNESKIWFYWKSSMGL